MPSISKELDFTESTGREIAILKYGKEWPIVYILYDEDEAYVGETVDARMRMIQHYDNPDRRKMKHVRIISDETFNKSAILDLEAFLISHMSADSRFSNLQNGNMGHQKHNYYQKQFYESQFKDIWKRLHDLGLAEKDSKKIENSNIFKYSPYKTLTADQYAVATGVIKSLVEDIRNKRKSTFIVEGAPGTGKTIVGVYLMKLLCSDMTEEVDSENEELLMALQELHTLKPDLKIGLVVSMVNLRQILKNTFRSTYGLNEKMVYGPGDVARSTEKFDLLIVDEAHRLKAPRAVGAEIGSMQNNNVRLGLDKKKGTQLDWIMKMSDHQVLLYDPSQTIKKADIDRASINKLENVRKFDLETQLRCMSGGVEYITFMKKLFSNEKIDNQYRIGSYDLRVFDDVKEMTDLIKQRNKNSEIGLCRNIAGYGWKWSTKDEIHPTNERETEKCIASGYYDIDIENNKYIWNTKYDGWIASENSINEIGCIHTIQGFDLNYAGVIIGNELKYDEENEKLIVDKDSYFDAKGKESANDEELYNYIMNIYYVLCTRGINGTYIYICDPALRKHIKRMIEEYTVKQTKKNMV